MTTDIGTVVGRILLIELFDDLVPFIDVIGENHKLLPVPDGRYLRNASEMVEKVAELDSILYRAGAEHTQEGDKEVIKDLGRWVKPGDPKYPYAVANYCARFDLPTIYRPNEPQNDG
ncbi:MAG: hypothetical protein QF568_02940 [Flavobacteriales bacterium]|jgi:hypothetical protein|nr:hypothetical protein [Flavobacteriales bacterium]|tara:strand:- start:1185 stop:1535 length:351 start_codon:yes stop_codon:yes gene_type:complete